MPTYVWVIIVVVIIAIIWYFFRGGESSSSKKTMSGSESGPDQDIPMKFSGPETPPSESEGPPLEMP